MVATIHGWTSTGNGYSRMRLYEWLDSKSLRFMDSIVLVSEAMKSHPRLRHLNQSRVHVIHNGIPIPDAQATQRTQATQQTQITKDLDPEILNFCSHGFTIGAIGRLSTEKGFGVLIQSLAILVAKGIDARLVIMGEGGQRKELQQLAAAGGISDRVLLPGYCQNARNYMKFFGVFVLSSFTEGLPITLLEAMQAKVSIVATNVGGIAESLGNGEAGILVEPGSPEDLADGVEKIYSSADLAKNLESTAYELVANQFSSQTMARKYHQLYKVSTQSAFPG
jgi:glycosyltransferase involved in cell wall biosynthesis